MNSECGREYRELIGSPYSLRFGAMRSAMKAAPLTFAKPPYTDVQLLAIETAEEGTYLAYKTGGEAQKANYDIAHKVSLKAMDDTADYVDETAQGDTDIIALGSFKPTNTSRVKAVKPVQPTGVVVKRDAADGEMLASCDSVGESHKYGCIVSDLLLPTGISINAGGQIKFPSGMLANVIIDLNQSRNKKLIGLVSGTMYYFYFYIVNAAGVSTLSAVFPLRCG
jgi:hypothetical protein